MIDEKDMVLIEGYYSESLTVEQKQAFEAKIKTDSEFARKAENYRAAMKSIEMQGRGELKQQLKQIHNDTVTKKVSYGSLLKIAAIFTGLALFAAAVVYLILMNTGNRYEQMYASAFQSYPDVTTFRSDEAPANETFRQAMSLYKKGEFEKASLLFRELEKTGAGSIIHFYHGVSSLAAGNERQAIVLFRKIDSENSPFYGQARWYLALSYLRMKEIEESRAILKDVVDRNLVTAEQAAELLQKLDE